MAKAIVTITIMPESPDVDMDMVTGKALSMVKEHYGDVETKTDIEPIAFGLKALKLIYVMDESKGSTDEFEKKLTEIEGVQGVEVTDVRRAIG